jgi:outer membrane lipopolysaccharide assembly protein LptE/RlpB
LRPETILRAAFRTLKGLRSAAPLLAACAGLVATSACGYHVAGRAASLPENWKTVAIPAFVNRTSRYRIEQRFTEAVIREMLARTSYRVIQDETVADGILRGEVTSIETSPVLFDAATGRVTTVLVTVHASVKLTDRATSRTVYQNNSVVLRDEYQISPDVDSFFEEQDPALERLARDFASRVVAGVLDNF